MVALTRTSEVVWNANTPSQKSIIYVRQREDPNNSVLLDWKKALKPKWVKYQIKETDFRVKTATFTSRQKIDLSTGRYDVLITSPYHESFAGTILKIEKDKSNGPLFTYQCQDFSRNYISKFGARLDNVPLYNFMRYLLSRAEIQFFPKPEKIQEWKLSIGGLRALKSYDQSLYGSTIRFNPFSGKTSMFIQDKSFIEVIRDVVLGSGAYIDIYFDIYGILHLQPYHKDDLFNSGLHLTAREPGNRKYSFDTTNIITGVIVKSNEKGETGKFYSSKQLVKLDLSAFFGKNDAMIDNPNPESSTEVKSTNANNNNENNSSNSNQSNTVPDNPYGDKAKKIWIGADTGSGDIKSEIISLLQRNGWECHDSGTGPNVHYTDYEDVTSDYQVLAIVDNGFDPATVIEPYNDGSIKNMLADKGVTCMFFFDTRTWTEGMRPYRYGDFNGYHSHRAWDDNYSNFSGTLNVEEYFRQHDVKYCASPSAEGIVEHFLAGGYYKYKGI